MSGAVVPPDADEQRRAERSAAALLEGDAATAHMGVVLEHVAPGYARMRMTINETMVNGHGTCHGGFLFAFGDSTFAVACNSCNRRTVAASASIEFLAPARLGDVLYGEGRMLKQGRIGGLYDVTISAADGRAIALFRGRSHRLDTPLYDEADPSTTSEASS